MNRIAEEIKSKVTMADLLERYGIETRRNGFILCPFHQEKTPSCKIYKDGYYCFGCGVGGDVISFVKNLFSLSFLDAAKKIGLDFGLPIDCSCSNNKKEELPEYLYSQRERRRKEREKEKKYSDMAKEFRNLSLSSVDLTDAQQARLEYLDYALWEMLKEWDKNGG